MTCLDEKTRWYHFYFYYFTLAAVIVKNARKYPKNGLGTAYETSITLSNIKTSTWNSACRYIDLVSRWKILDFFENFKKIYSWKKKSKFFFKIFRFQKQHFENSREPSEVPWHCMLFSIDTRNLDGISSLWGFLTIFHGTRSFFSLTSNCGTQGPKMAKSPNFCVWWTLLLKTSITSVTIIARANLKLPFPIRLNSLPQHRCQIWAKVNGLAYRGHQCKKCCFFGEIFLRNAFSFRNVQQYNNTRVPS